MVKVNGPAMSLDASGSIAGAMVFSKWKGRNYVRQLVRPANPRSQGQTYNRALMKYLAQAWVNVSAPNKATWEEGAESGKYSPFNAFVRYNMREWQSALAPSHGFPATRVAPGTTTPTAVATGGQRRATIALSVVAGAPDGGWIICRLPGTSNTPTIADAIAVVPVSVTDYIDSPLEAGGYSYNAIPISITGGQDAATPDTDATVS